MRIFMLTLLTEIEQYWTKRAEGYSQVNQNELHSEQKQKWQQTLLKYLNLTEIKTKHILDIGTGPGFFAIILDVSPIICLWCVDFLNKNLTPFNLLANVCCNALISAPLRKI